jgi:hypothetical protein
MGMMRLNDESQNSWDFHRFHRPFHLPTETRRQVSPGRRQILISVISERARAARHRLRCSSLLSMTLACPLRANYALTSVISVLFVRENIHHAREFSGISGNSEELIHRRR